MMTKKIIALLISCSFWNSCYAELKTVYLQRVDDTEIESIQGRCEDKPEGLLCNLTETHLKAKTAECRITTRQYVLTLKQQGPSTWGMSSFGSICKNTETVTVELIPKSSPLAWPA